MALNALLSMCQLRDKGTGCLSLLNGRYFRAMYVRPQVSLQIRDSSSPSTNLPDSGLS